MWEQVVRGVQTGLNRWEKQPTGCRANLNCKRCQASAAAALRIVADRTTSAIRTPHRMRTRCWRYDRAGMYGYFFMHTYIRGMHELCTDRLRSRTLLRLPRHLGGLRRGLNGPNGRGSGRMFLIMLHSGLCRLRLRRAGTWARRR